MITSEDRIKLVLALVKAESLPVRERALEQSSLLSAYERRVREEEMAKVERAQAELAIVKEAASRAVTSLMLAKQGS